MTRTFSKKFKFQFYVQIKDKEFEIFTSSPEERQMWMAGFNYVVKSSQEMQNIV